MDFRLRSVFFIPLVFLVATCSLYFLATKLAPASHSRSELRFPATVSDLKDLSRLLIEYRDQHSVYVFVLFSSAYVYKQTFAIPGSAFLNLLAGALYGLYGGFPLVCLLTAIGASLCFLLSKCFGRQSIEYYFANRVVALRRKVDENRDCLFFFLLFVRLFPITPNWFINVASPILNVPLHLFFVTVLLGLMPYNFISVQTGVFLAKIHSLDEVFSYGVIIKLLLIAFVALVPSFFLKRKVNLTSGDLSTVCSEEEKVR